MEERFTFTDSVAGLKLALDTTLMHRRHGFRTRLATRQWGRFIVHTVIATSPARPNRVERGAILKPEAPYVAQARQIANDYNRLADKERRPDLEEC